MPTPSPPAVITLSGVKHSFRKFQALVDINFEVPAQTLHGFVGPNGAGKTTVLKLICTLLTPQAGSIRVFDLDVQKDYREVRRRLGFMPDHFSMYRQMTVYEYLDFFAAAYGLPQETRTRVLDDVLELTDMGGRRSDLINGLSRGMQQRVGLARAFATDAPILLMDEPFSALDPLIRTRLQDELLELQAKLLRFLQERVEERVGGRKEIPVDVRILCATHKDLAAEVAAERSKRARPKRKRAKRAAK